MLDLATTYSHGTYRPTTIGAKPFHFRVRNGTGWFQFAMVTRGLRVGCWVLFLELVSSCSVSDDFSVTDGVVFWLALPYGRPQGVCLWLVKGLTRIEFTGTAYGICCVKVFRWSV